MFGCRYVLVIGQLECVGTGQAPTLPQSVGILSVKTAKHLAMVGQFECRDFQAFLNAFT